MSLAHSTVNAALRLTPAAYRRERGDEIAGVFAATADGAGTWSVWREALDVAGHLLRVRLRLTSRHPGGRFAAALGPLLAAAAVVPMMVGTFYSVTMLSDPGWHTDAAYGAQLATFVLGAALLVTLLAGRWGAARLVAVPLLLVGCWGKAGWMLGSGSSASGVLFAVASLLPFVLGLLGLLAAPTDLLPKTAARRVPPLLALLAAAFLADRGTLTVLLFLMTHQDQTPAFGPVVRVAMDIAAVAMPLALAVSRRWLPLAALVLAVGLPLAAQSGAPAELALLIDTALFAAGAGLGVWAVRRRGTGAGTGTGGDGRAW
ncbi:hypothetical protein BIV57_03505 [Mangrovactinospora gilvigrisea]|uniref:Uncharacterized protein n=1 Tax=Mangrovactinospora gilvigrisea TaxID=1428644 RepID=A0A1J7CBD6_9ACTN|nr:hypothetical protein [Mangrovactinospora gilvigrisea]OIV38820.1 hypothetical protein BIV57_03505 [Mangrovactinospora gilvigrisea]